MTATSVCGPVGAQIGSITINRRFNGPDRSANGGYACGQVARFIDGPAEVTLRFPPALDRPLAVMRDDSAPDQQVTVWDSYELVAEAREAQAILLDPRVFPSVREADEASARHPGISVTHPPSNCFVCGPTRATGLGLCAGPLERNPDIGAAVLRADDTLPNDDGVLAPEVVWAALDCPSFTPGMWKEGRLCLLARLTAELLSDVRVGDTLIAVGWPLLQQGRKYQTAAALLTPEGRTVARSRAVWIGVS